MGQVINEQEMVGDSEWMSQEHQYFHNFLAGACASLYKLVQALKVCKLPVKPAMSKF
jgi:hypothetical protein